MLQPFDQDAWARVYSAYSFDATWTTYKALRAWNVAFVRGAERGREGKDVQRIRRAGKSGYGRLWRLWLGMTCII